MNPVIMPHLIVLPIIVIFMVLITVLSALAHRKWGSGYDNGFLVTAWIGGVFGSLVAIITVFNYLPFDSKHHVFTHHEGTVVSVTSGVKSGSENVTNEFSVRFEGDEEIYTSTDVRVANYEPGDELALSCSLEWVINGSDRYNCNVSDLKEKN